MKKALIFLNVCLLCHAWALDGTAELRALGAFDSYVDRYLSGTSAEKSRTISEKKMESLKGQIDRSLNKKRREYYTYLHHLFCQKRSLTNGIVCQDNFHTDQNLTTASDKFTLDELRSIITDVHSTRRINQGLGELTLSRKLNKITSNYASKLCEAGIITHELNGSQLEERFKHGKYAYEWAGENLALGQKTIGDLMDQLTTSIHHRENIYRPEFTEIGIGHCDNIWVINYGKPAQ